MSEGGLGLLSSLGSILSFLLLPIFVSNVNYQIAVSYEIDGSLAE
jgi:hypothetical protein